MKSRKIALTGILMSIVFQSIAAEPDTLNQELSYMPFQVSFITPFGTNGYESLKTVNNISLNIIAGYHGGLEGIEFGGVANLLQNDMNGIQFGGFTNIVGGSMEGVQVAGFSNLVREESDGIQVAGFTNHAADGGGIIQVAGFSNQAMGSFEGAQIAGFGNLATDSSTALQVAGFGNFAGRGSEVTQVAGFMNSTRGKITGTQVAGFLNAADRVDGVQASGFLNVADTVSGTQIGFINIADTFTSGVPFGFISLVKKGHKALLIQANELQWFEAQFHLGVPKLYNVFATAIKPIGNRPGWSFGYGIGTTLMDRKQSDIRLEGVLYHINEDEMWTSAINNLIRISARYEYHPKNNGFSITAGPSLNFLWNSNWDIYGEDFTSKTAPYSILSSESNSFTSATWIGGQIGLTF